MKESNLRFAVWMTGSRSIRGVRRRGFTLAELVVSVSVLSVLMGGLASAMVIATKAMDGGSTRTARSVRAAHVMARVNEDLSFAISFSERTPTAATFEVPDRDLDGLPDVIRYAWSGVAGDPLTVEYNNSGNPRTIAENVHDFDLSYLLVTRDPPPPPVGVEGPEQLLIYHDNGPSPQNELFTIGVLQHCAQCFQPTLPPDALSWRITRVKIVAQRVGKASGNNYLQIRPVQPDGKPSTLVLDQKTFAEAGMPGTLFWFQFSFTTLAELDPAVGMCMVLSGDASGTAAILYENGGSPMTPLTHFLQSGDSGSTWSAPNDTTDMIFLVYGTVTTPGS